MRSSTVPDGPLIRPFQDADAAAVAAILKANDQYAFPAVEGPAAMARVAACPAAVDRVAVFDGRVAGYVKAVYDGSRALLHLLSVHPDYQGRGLGRALVEEVEGELRRRGAPSLSVLVTQGSVGWWERRGFSPTPAFLLLKVFEDQDGGTRKES
ncbi:MAG: GNAT family N-acetyltransferase [Candidatus Coatesbacteria bacterium]|nr:GNAT family N-acetyltransferase [Candidatus Coatesbacteria bacterium]